MSESAPVDLGLKGCSTANMSETQQTELVTHRHKYGAATQDNVAQIEQRWSHPDPVMMRGWPPAVPDPALLTTECDHSDSVPTRWWTCGTYAL